MIEKRTRRTMQPATPGMGILGPLKALPGVWKNIDRERNFDALAGRGWNLIALPFGSDQPGLPPYRVLMNQYNENLKFTTVSANVPNRGIKVIGPNVNNLDQTIVTLDYEQVIDQIAQQDFPASGLEGDEGDTIHHEPGLWLNMTNFNSEQDGAKIDIARLGTIPHGDSVLAHGSAQVELDVVPDIPDVDTLPIGSTRDLNSPYLAPYRHFSDIDADGNSTLGAGEDSRKFQGLFDALDPSALLRSARAAFADKIVKTTVLTVSTEIKTGGIENIPFIVKHANATEMQSTFWLMQLNETDQDGLPVFHMQYMQQIMLEFFARTDNEPGLIKWPHVSFNTMRRFPLANDEKLKYSMT